MDRKILNCPYCGKILPRDFPSDAPKKDVKCTVCGSLKNWKDGKINLPQLPSIQRYICRDCGTRFTEH